MFLNFNYSLFLRLILLKDVVQSFYPKKAKISKCYNINILKCSNILIKTI